MSTRASIPNQLTVLRLILASGLFVAMALFSYADQSTHWLLLLSIVLFVAAAITDALDGHLARKWQVESTFGRIVDPFADKVLVLGAFIMLAGANYSATPLIDAYGAKPDQHVFTGDLEDYPTVMLTGIYPWMVVLILGRELLVTAIRGVVESTGQKFGANVCGKLKMILQSIVVPIVLLIVWLDPMAEGHEWLAVLRDVLVYATVVATIISGVPYVTGARRLLASQEKQETSGSQP